MLRGVVEARPAAVAAQRARLSAAVGALDGAVAPAAAASRERVLEAVCAPTVASAEASLSAVDSMLRDDPDAAAMLRGLAGRAPST